MRRFDDPTIYYNNCLFHFKTKLEITPTTTRCFFLLLFHFKVDCCFKDLLVLTHLICYTKVVIARKEFLFFFFMLKTSVRKYFISRTESKFYFFKCVDKIKIDFDTLPTSSYLSDLSSIILFNGSKNGLLCLCHCQFSYSLSPSLACKWHM